MNGWSVPEHFKTTMPPAPNLAEHGGDLTVDDFLMESHAPTPYATIRSAPLFVREPGSIAEFVDVFGDAAATGHLAIAAGLTEFDSTTFHIRDTLTLKNFIERARLFPRIQFLAIDTLEMDDEDAVVDVVMNIEPIDPDATDENKKVDDQDESTRRKRFWDDVMTTIREVYAEVPDALKYLKMLYTQLECYETCVRPLYQIFGSIETLIIKDTRRETPLALNLFKNLETLSIGTKPCLIDCGESSDENNPKLRSLAMRVENGDDWTDLPSTLMELELFSDDEFHHFGRLAETLSGGKCPDLYRFVYDVRCSAPGMCPVKRWALRTCSEIFMKIQNEDTQFAVEHALRCGELTFFVGLDTSQEIFDAFKTNKLSATYHGMPPGARLLNAASASPISNSFFLAWTWSDLAPFKTNINALELYMIRMRDIYFRGILPAIVSFPEKTNQASAGRKDAWCLKKRDICDAFIVGSIVFE